MRVQQKSTFMMIGDVLLTIADTITNLARNHYHYGPGRATHRLAHQVKPHPRYAYKGRPGLSSVHWTQMLTGLW